LDRILDGELMLATVDKYELAVSTIYAHKPNVAFGVSSVAVA
jgi:hypothetical protein